LHHGTATIRTLIQEKQICLMTDILSVIGSIDQQLFEGEHDSVFGLTRFLLQMLPEEEVVKKMVEASKKQ
jgi:hypothetical protein